MLCWAWFWGEFSERSPCFKAPLRRSYIVFSEGSQCILSVGAHMPDSLPCARKNNAVTSQSSAALRQRAASTPRAQRAAALTQTSHQELGYLSGQCLALAACVRFFQATVPVELDEKLKGMLSSGPNSSDGVLLGCSYVGCRDV